MIAGDHLAAATNIDFSLRVDLPRLGFARLEKTRGESTARKCIELKLRGSDPMSTDKLVSRHYSNETLEKAILEALTAAGKDIDNLSHADLAPVDEFHIGGRQATIDFAGQLRLHPGMHLLDVGCRLGGASRYFAQEHGCRVTGIDLTQDYVNAAGMLSARVGLDGAVSYQTASALSLPFPDHSFDGAYMLHVGMNIADKTKVFAEVRRVLRPGSVFGIYDVMRENSGEFIYPVPWSTAPETNFIDTAASYKQSLAAAGFIVDRERSRRDFAIEFFRQLRERVAQSGPSPLGLQILMGATTPQKIANMTALLDRGVIAPTEIISRAA
jgi:ubiquinone/menaquinone biosynthesis C-methylase UbiE